MALSRKHLLAPYTGEAKTRETPSVALGDTSLKEGGKKMMFCGDEVRGRMTPSVSLRSTAPVIGLPQRFCGAKDLWEEETQAQKAQRLP